MKIVTANRRRILVITASELTKLADSPISVEEATRILKLLGFTSWTKNAGHITWEGPLGKLGDSCHGINPVNQSKMRSRLRAMGIPTQAFFDAQERGIRWVPPAPKVVAPPKSAKELMRERLEARFKEVTEAFNKPDLSPEEAEQLSGEYAEIQRKLATL